MTQSMKLSKQKLTKAEIAFVGSFLDAFEASGFACLINLDPKLLVYPKKHGLRFEVLTAIAQSAVIDYPGHFGPLDNTRLCYNFLISKLMFTFYECARITYDEGDGTIEDFRVKLAFSPPSGGNCLTDYDFVLDSARLNDLWELVPYDWAQIEV